LRFGFAGEKKPESDKILSPKRGLVDGCKDADGVKKEGGALTRRSCERRLFVPTSPEKRRGSEGALGSSLLRPRFETFSRYYYRPNPDGRGGSVGTDNEHGDFVPAPGTWLVNSRLEIISYPIPGMFACGEPGGVYIVEEEDDDQDVVDCRLSNAKDEVCIFFTEEYS